MKLMTSRIILGALMSMSVACAQADDQGPVSPMPQLPELSGRIIIAGDSTAADYPLERAPQIGWGQVLDYYLPDDVEVLNLAVNGRSTKSYIDEGRWAALMDEVGAGDIVLISFGHNDSRDDAPERYAAPEGAYRENLIRFASDVQGAGGEPVILSSAARRLWEGPAMVETHGLYRQNAFNAAIAAGVDYIDLAQLSLNYFETLGRVATKDDFLWLTAEEVAERLPAYVERYPDGIEDNTHFTETGACGVARIIAERLGNEFGLHDDAAISDEPADEAGRPADVLACAAVAWE